MESNNTLRRPPGAAPLRAITNCPGKWNPLTLVIAAVLALAKVPAGTKAKVAKARAFVEQRQRETMAVVKKHLLAS